MKHVAAALLALVAVGTMSMPANAQFSRYNVGINGTQSQLQTRINVGLRNGSLTQREATKLQSELNQLTSMEARMRANGLSQRERSILNSKLMQLSNNVNRELNDFQKRRVGYRNNHRWNR